MTGEAGGRAPATGRVVQLALDAPHVSPSPPPGLDGSRRGSLAGLAPRQRQVAEVTRGAIGAHLLAVVTGLVGADYVGTADFSLVLPLLSGLACAWWVSRVATGLPRAVRAGLACGYGAASAVFAFLYSDTPYGSLGSWLPPVLAGVVGALVWPLVDPSPPKVGNRGP